MAGFRWTINTGIYLEILPVSEFALFSLQAAKKFVDGKKTMSASGHLINTPFVDEV